MTISADFWVSLGTALALILVIEGLFYALFPDGMQRMMASMQTLSPASLRRAGLFALILGVGLVWLIRG